jgi:hypothetical protein
MRTLLLVGALVAAPAWAAEPAVRYVDCVNGVAAPCGSQDAPCALLTAALASAPGDVRVEVAPGWCYSPPPSYEGEEPGEVYIVGREVTIRGEGAHLNAWQLIAGEGARLRLEGLDLAGVTVYSRAGASLEILSCSSTIGPSSVHAGDYVVPPGDVLVRASEVASVTWQNLSGISTPAGLTIEGSVVWNSVGIYCLAQHCGQSRITDNYFVRGPLLPAGAVAEGQLTVLVRGNLAMGTLVPQGPIVYADGERRR